MRILIAEDDSIIADGLCRTLRGNGFAVDRAAQNGLDADTALVTASTMIC
jgi:two-component system OmpR family response regulator